MRKIQEELILETNSLLSVEIFYRFQNKIYSCRLCYMVDNPTGFVLKTDSLVLGELFKELFISNLFLPWFQEDVSFFKIKINKTTFLINPPLLGTAPDIRNGAKGLYVCQLYCKTRYASTTPFKFRIRGFYCDVFPRPLFCDILFPLETLYLKVPYEVSGKPNEKSLELRFYGLSDINKMEVLELVESFEPFDK